jgi:DNA repair protein SbcD/Mre11
MKILHTADWHLGKRLETFSRHEEQVAVLNEICEIADREAVDAVIIAGDLFDVFSPPNESSELFFKTCKRLSNNGLRAVIAIAGNHDSPERIEAPESLARECGIVYAGFPHTVVPLFSLATGLKLTKTDKGFIELELPNCPAPLRLFLTPFANEYRLKQYLNMEKSDDNIRQILTEQWYNLAQKYANTDGTSRDNREGVNIGVSHLFVMQRDSEMPIEPDEERPINVGGAGVIYTDCYPLQLQYVALGHLHRQQEISRKPCPCVYSGSPLAYSFNEDNQDKYVMLLEAEPMQPIRFQRIKLENNKKLLRGRFEDIGEALTWLSENPDDLIQLTIVSETYLNPLVLQQLRSAHKGIVEIRPELLDPNAQSSIQNIDLNKNIDELFFDYFKREKNQEPNEDLKHLFKEILAVELEP